MVRFPALYFPPDLLMLLALDAPHTASTIEQIYIRTIGQFDHAKLLMKCFEEFDPKKNIKTIIKSLGWKGFRNRYASIYLYNLANGHFPDKTDLSLIQEVVSFESNLDIFVAVENSRPFLLGYFLKMCELHLIREGHTLDKNTLNVPLSVVNLLKYTSRKVQEIDWLILMMWHFQSFLGDEAYQIIMSNENLSYKEIFQRLDFDQINLLNENLLHYSYAINDHSKFLEKRV